MCIVWLLAKFSPVSVPAHIGTTPTNMAEHAEMWLVAWRGPLLSRFRGSGQAEAQVSIIVLLKVA